MKPLIGIFLCSCLIIPFTGVFIWLQYEQWEIQKEVEERIDSGIEAKELVTLKFDKEELSELRWEHDREFEFRGQMYDVIEKKKEGSLTVFVCWWDHEETRLKEEARKLLANHKSEQPWQNNTQSQLEHFVKTLIVDDSFPQKEFTFHHRKSKLFYLTGNYTSVVQCPPTPPPNLA